MTTKDEEIDKALSQIAKGYLKCLGCGEPFGLEGDERKQGNCADCSEPEHEECMSTCEVCNHQICEACYSGCSRCGAIMCEDCTAENC